MATKECFGSISDIVEISRQVRLVDANTIQDDQWQADTTQIRRILTDLRSSNNESLAIESLLTSWLYCIYYSKRLTTPATGNTASADELNRSKPKNEFELETADQPITYYAESSHWQYVSPAVQRRLSGGLLVQRGSEARWVGRGDFAEYAETKKDGTIAPLLRIYLPAKSGGGLYTWVYSAYPLQVDPQGMIRFYIHIKSSVLGNSTQADVLQVVRPIQAILDRYELPFQLKFIRDLNTYNRVDTAVLYAERKHFHLIARLLAVIYPLIRSSLGDQLPLFVRPLRPGLGFAESPPDGTSFGENRCRLLARALLSKNALGTQRADKRTDAVISYLSQHHYAPTAFYLNPHSSFEYDFSVFETSGFAANHPEQSLPLLTGLDEINWTPSAETNRKKYLDAALRIAFQLCKEAIFYQTESTWNCTWLSYHGEEKSGPGSYRIVDASFLYGTLGITTFLQRVTQYYPCRVFTDIVAILETANPVSQTEIKLPDGAFITSDNILLQALPYAFTDQPITPKAEQLADSIIREYLQEGRPIGNVYQPNSARRDLFCANVLKGLAGIGYFFLRVYNPEKVPGLLTIYSSGQPDIHDGFIPGRCVHS